VIVGDSRRLEQIVLSLLHGGIERTFRGGVGVELGRGRVVAGFDQGRQVRDEERHSVVCEEHRLSPNHLEEPGHVRQGFLRRCGVGRGKAREEPCVAQERIQNFTGRANMGQVGKAPKVGHHAANGLPGLS